MRSLFSFIFSFCFPLVLAFVGLSLTFLLFAAFSAVGALYLWRQLPETRGQSLEEIADYWRFRSGEKP
jgi:membrane protein implicated in regulation of membrane protease activity